MLPTHLQVVEITHEWRIKDYFLKDPLLENNLTKKRLSYNGHILEVIEDTVEGENRILKCRSLRSDLPALPLLVMVDN